MRKIYHSVSLIISILVGLLLTVRTNPVIATPEIREQIEKIQNPGLMAVYEAGLIETPGWTTKMEPLHADDTIPEGLTMTIDWYYADPTLMAAGYRISGLTYDPEACQLFGGLLVTDENGEEHWGVNSGLFEWDPDSGDISGYFLGIGSTMEMLLQNINFSIDTILGNPGELATVPFGFFPNQYCGKFIQLTEIPPDAIETPFAPGKFHFSFNHLTSDQLLTLEIPQTVTKKDVQIRTFWAEITPTTTQIAFSLEKPTAEHWVPDSFFSGNPTLKIGNRESEGAFTDLIYDADVPDEELSELNLLRLEKLPDRNIGERYGILRFPIGILNNPETLILTIPSIEPFSMDANPFDSASRKIEGPWQFTFEADTDLIDEEPDGIISEP